MKRLHGKKGFTLVEIMVTLAIAGIMLAGSVMGVGAYIDYSNFRSNNDCAYSLFMTIQSALAQEKASGELERIKNTYSLETVELEDSGREVKSIKISKGDLTSPDALAFLDIAGDYIYDRGMLDASILVELDMTEGTLYSVAYSKQAAGLSYESFNTSNPTGDDVSVAFGNRERSIRRGTLLGYYSSDLPDPAPSSLGRPSINFVKLTNGETLDLSWRMNGRYRTNTNNLIYDVELIGASNNNKLASFTINDNDSKMLANGNTACAVKFFNGATETTVPITFETHVDSSYVVHLVLDKVDIAAATQAELAAPVYSTTQSAMRFSSLWGGYTGDIRAVVQARRSTTAVSAKATSPKENLLLGSSNTIQNARHLFNLRFIEGQAEFKQTASFAWGGSNGIISRGNVANVESSATDTAFPSIASLASGSTLKGAENLKISYLTLSGGEQGQAQNGVALFRENYGEIKSVSFANATVNAPNSDLVAVVCGINHGGLTNVSVDGASKVTGRNYVGGIAGYDDSATGRARSGLKNAAAVTGESYVGGVFGATARIDGATGDSGILQCENTGAIRSSSAQGCFIGGIAGLNSGRTLTKCTSTPKGELSKVASATDLKGRFVGGIVGLQASGGLTDCNTGGGLVAGGEYVGGIVGLNAAAELAGENNSHNRADVVGTSYVGGIAGANTDATIETNKITATLPGTTTTLTTATVTSIGVTANADGTWPTSDNNIIRNWVNEGIVVANGSYAGGITGFNAGTIQDCSSNVNVSTSSGASQLEAIKKLASPTNLGRLADYTGGIAGANVNIIVAPVNTRFVSVTAGRDYVGGIVGYNAPGSRVTGFTVDDAYVAGRCFVGGFMGLNCEPGIYGENNTINTIEAHPSRVEGEYFVGGIMGGSIIASAQDVTLHCIANNYQGNILAENGAGVGGLIGYNAMLENSADCLTLAQRLTAKLDGWLGQNYIPATDGTSAAHLQSITRLFINDIDRMEIDAEDEDDVLPAGSDATFIIEPYKQYSTSPDELRIEFYQIKGFLYAGGAIGYNCENTRVTAQKIINVSNVTGTGAVAEKADNWEGIAVPPKGAETFSYVGGIAGRITQHMQVIECANDSRIRVKSAGSYAGLLAEVNEGIVSSCTTIGASGSGSNDLGGIVGLNRRIGNNNEKTSGYIAYCALTGDLSGDGGVGGIAAVNRGLIEHCDVNSKAGVSITGEGAVGAIAAHNEGEIRFCTVAGNTKLQGQENVGGIAGKNGGSIIDCTVATGTTIHGEKYVGGFAGSQVASSSTNVIVSSLTNVATVSGNDFVGGIIGRAEGAVTVQSCENTQPVSAVAENGYAGGILAYNAAKGVIKNCKNTAEVSAPQGSAGGVAAYNAGTITSCAVASATTGSANVTGSKNVGGIAGENAGSVSSCELAGVNVSGAANAAGANVGGVAGLNIGSIGPASATSLTVTGRASGGALGGVAGQNRGGIKGADTRTPFNATVKLESGLAGYTGGIAGWNRGTGSRTATVEGYTFTGRVTADGSELYGYGGIVGVNGDPDSLSNIALIKNCRVDSKKTAGVENDFNDADLSDASDAECTLVTTVKANVCVGGIAGLNCQRSAVANSTLESCYIRGYYGYVGGIAGHNKGVVSDCAADTATNTTITKQKPTTTDKDYNTGFKVKIYMYNGDVGGIVGRAARTADVDRCATGQDWVVLVSQINDSNKTEGTDNTCAGIIGYNASDNDLTDLKNFARVRKSLGSSFIGGGIIGRQENVTSKLWRIASCTNYGNVQGVQRAGGIIAQWKYNGGTVENCENYGYIYATGGAGSGGIVGSTAYASANQRYIISNCFNGGTIRGNGAAAGGIVGLVSAKQNTTYAIIYDSVNVGAASNGGIIGQKSDSIRAEIHRCINYSSAPANSISYSAVTVKNSFGVPSDKNLGVDNNSKLNFRLHSGVATPSDANAKVIEMGVVSGTTSLKAEGEAGDVLYTIPELALDPNIDDVRKNDPYGNYLAINQQLKDFIKGLYSGDVVSPAPVTVGTSSGAYLATWTTSPSAYQYDVTVEVGSGEGDDFVASVTTLYTAFENQLSFSVDSQYEGKGLEIRVTVVAVNGSGTSRATATSVPYGVKRSLAMPKAHYEIVYEDNTLKGRWRLLNSSEYGTDTDVLGKITVNASFSAGGGKGEFTVLSKQSNATDFDGSGANNITTSVMASGGDYIHSATFSVQTQRPGRDLLTSATPTDQLSTMSEPYLTGIRPSELACKLTLTKKYNQVLRRTELVVTNTDLGNNVEVVIGESHNDRITATAGHDITLALVQSLVGGQSYTVRSYPWGTQGVADGTKYISGCAYGHAVAENVPRASLTTIRDPWDMKATPTQIYYDTPGNETLTRGYVLSLNEDGSYDIYYSVLLDYVAGAPKNGESQFCVQTKTAPGAVAAPVLSASATSLGGGRYSFSWTAEKGTTADIYEAEVLGTTFAGNETTLAVPVNAIQSTNDGGTLTLDLSTGSYRSVKIAITRLGKAKANGKPNETELLGNVSDPQIYTIPRSLPAIGGPGVQVTDRADVKYTVSWTPETGYAQQDTEGYTLWLATNSTLSTPTALATPSTLASDTSMTIVDLEEYQGQAVWLYLTAQRVASPTNYTQDSPTGAATPFTVASRITLSSKTTIALSEEYVEGTATTVDSFNNALKISASDADAKAYGSFALQAMILPTEAKNLDDGAPAATDTGLAIAWEPNTANMTSSVNNSLTQPSTYSLGDLAAFSEDYAAMWICARVRAISSSNDPSQLISSHWTDYEWLQLPRVLLDAPHKAEHSEPMLCEGREIEYTTETVGDDSQKLTLRQATLEWTWDKHAGYCDISIEDNAGTTYGIQLACDAAGVVTATNTSVATPTAMTGASVASSTTFTWKKSASTAETPQYGDTITYKDSAGGDHTVNVETRLTVASALVDGKVVTTCTLTLPDYDQVELNGILKDAVFTTRRVTLRYAPIDGRYEASPVRSWAWAEAQQITATFAERGYVFDGGQA